MLLTAQGITKRFGGLVALEGVNLHLNTGEILGLIGPNGSGKTTLFNCITGLLTPDTGTILLDGVDITGWSPYRVARAGLSRTFQQSRLYNQMSVVTNMLISSHPQYSLIGLLTPPSRAERARAEEILTPLTLWEAREMRAADLSGGQQKLLEIGMALMPDSPLLLLDEPAGGINPTLLATIMELLRRINTDQRKSLLIIEHNMPVIMGVAHRIVVLNHGVTIAEWSPSEIQSNPSVLEAYLGEV